MKGFVQDIESLAIRNDEFRQVVYTAGKTLTITRADGTEATYVINDKSMVPSDLVVGKTITIMPVTTNADGELVVQRIIYVPVKPRR